MPLASINPIEENNTKKGTTFSKTFPGNAINNKPPTIEPVSKNKQYLPNSPQWPLIFFADASRTPGPVKISAAVLVMLAATGEHPAISKAGYETGEAILATAETTPDKTPAIIKNTINPIDDIMNIPYKKKKSKYMISTFLFN